MLDVSAVLRRFKRDVKHWLRARIHPDDAKAFEDKGASARLSGLSFCLAIECTGARPCWNQSQALQVSVALLSMRP
eukprot:12135431-Alexandrium_andersonii.AAC.1